MLMRVMLAVALLAILMMGATAHAQSPTPRMTDGADCSVNLDGGATYQGSGHDVLDIGRLDAGVYIVEATRVGDHGLDVFLVGRNTGNTEWVLFVWPETSETTVLRIETETADDYLLEVAGDGDWEITIVHA